VTLLALATNFAASNNSKFKDGGEDLLHDRQVRWGTPIASPRPKLRDGVQAFFFW